MSSIAAVLENGSLMSGLLTEDMTQILDILGKEMTLAQFYS